jgi:hypothetical protein
MQLPNSEMSGSIFCTFLCPCCVLVCYIGSWECTIYLAKLVHDGMPSSATQEPLGGGAMQPTMLAGGDGAHKMIEFPEWMCCGSSSKLDIDGGLG